MTSTFERVRTEDGTAIAVDIYRRKPYARLSYLLHGGGQNRHAWATTARRLHARGYMSSRMTPAATATFSGGDFLDRTTKSSHRRGNRLT
jgi:hypothetical protein